MAKDRQVLVAISLQGLFIVNLENFRECSHITSAKIRGSWTPPPPSVSNGQHLAYPPSPPRQQWSAFGLPPLPPSSAFVSICSTPLLYYNFLHRLVYMIKWRIFICQAPICMTYGFAQGWVGLQMKRQRGNKLKWIKENSLEFKSHLNRANGAKSTRDVKTERWPFLCKYVIKKFLQG